jgi:hypothetical protein
MRRLLDIAAVGTRIVTSGRIFTLTVDLGDGSFTWSDNQTPPATGTIYFDDTTTENEDLIIID